MCAKADKREQMYVKQKRAKGNKWDVREAVAVDEDGGEPCADRRLRVVDD